MAGRAATACCKAVREGCTIIRFQFSPSAMERYFGCGGHRRTGGGLQHLLINLGSCTTIGTTVIIAVGAAVVVVVVIV